MTVKLLACNFLYTSCHNIQPTSLDSHENLIPYAGIIYLSHYVNFLLFYLE